MSTLLPGIDSRTLGGASGVGGVDATQGGVGGDIALGQAIGGMGAMDLLGTTRAMNIRANAIDLSLALQGHRDRSAKNVIASI